MLHTMKKMTHADDTELTSEYKKGLHQGRLLSVLLYEVYIGTYDYELKTSQRDNYSPDQNGK